MAEGEMVVDSSARKRKRSRNEKGTRRTDEELKSKRERNEDPLRSEVASLVRPANEDTKRSKEWKKTQSTEPEKGQGSFPARQFEEMKARKRREREERKRKKNEDDLQLQNETIVDTSPDQSKELTRSNGGGKWVISDPVGGRLLHLDPQFTDDEEYFAVAKKQGLYIYSTSTSILFKTLPVKSPDNLSSFCFSATSPQNVYLATTTGNILCWDWEVGQLAGQWHIGSRISSIIAVADNDEADDVIYTLRKTKRCLIEKHTPDNCKEQGKLKSQRLLDVARPLQTVQILARGDIIVTAYSGGLYVGELLKQGPGPSDNLLYTWREVSCIEPLTCFEARYIPSKAIASVKKEKGSSRKVATSNLDIAIGGVRGAIIVLRNFLAKLKVEAQDSDNLPVSSDLLAPRILHWHREAVGALKWSRDGNYLISGGRETVLILWQLETGRRQELPHLTSAIDNIVVSPSGSSYLMQLADNSAMVLSTSELSPTAYVAGLQSRIVSMARSDAPQIRTTEEFKNKVTEETFYAKFAAAINPRKSNEVLLAAPSSQSWTEPKDIVVSSPHLQSFDITRGYQIARQALTRNHATSVNVGPEATKLEEPNVILLDITSDGRWLATVEEWVPPLVDLEYLAPGSKSRLKEQARRREVYLKFWLWDEEANSWALQTRINHPHRSFESAESGITFDLAAHSKRAQFATVGEDCIVRVWKAVPRMRDGTIVVRGGRGEELYTWKCQFSVTLERPMVGLDDEEEREDNKSLRTPHLARLCYSQDGSVLAICHQLPGKSPSLGKYYLADARGGAIVKTGLGLYSGDLHGVAILDNYLVILSDLLVVWDLVKYELVYGLTVEHEQLRPGMKLVTALLAVSPTSDTIAVTLSYISSSVQNSRDGKSASRKKTAMGDDEVVDGDEIEHQNGKGFESRKDRSGFATVTDLYIFDPHASAKPLFRHEFPEVVTSLLPSPVLKGYVLIDVAAQVHSVNCRPSLPPDYTVDDALRQGTSSENAASAIGDVSLAATNGDGLASILSNEDKIDASVLLRNHVQRNEEDGRAKAEREALATRTTDDDEHMEVDGHDGDDDDNKGTSGPDASLLIRTEYDKPVVRPEELAAVLDVAPSHALPPVEELMYGVIRLFSRKKRDGE